MKSGHLIVIEGPENTGKTTFAEALPQALTQRGVATSYFSFPGRDTASVGAVVYELEHQPAHFGMTTLPPATRQVLHLAAHLDAIEARIKPTLAAGQWVVLDRYWWSMWAHGRAQGVSTTLLSQLVAIECEAWHPVKPAAIFCTLRSAPFEDQITPEWEAVCEAYRQLIEAQQGQSPIQCFGADQPLEQRITSCLAQLTTLGLLPSP